MSDATSICPKCGAAYRGNVPSCPSCNAVITPVKQALNAGEIVDGKYEILSLLGAGGMGEVYKCRHIHLDAVRTIKVMRKSLTADPEYQRRFVREARIATLVQHPNVAMVHDFASLPDGTYFMVSEFIEGVTLRQWARAHGRFSVRLATGIAVQVLSGLEAIHRAGLLHRDVSPDNIMICSEDDAPAAKIIDLGIAKVMESESETEGTQVGIFVGNPRYTSPEQLGALADGERLDARADLYCLGLVLYEMLAGVPAFASKTPHGYVAKHLTEAPLPLTARENTRGLPAALNAVVMKALEKKRENRFGSAREFTQALAPFMVEAISTTTQTKLASLRGSLPPETPPPSPATSTLTPPPESREAEAQRAWAAQQQRDEQAILDHVQKLAERGDVSALTKLSAENTASSAMGRAVRAALDRMASESLRQHTEATSAAEARLLRDEARDYASAASANTGAAWRSFLKAWPESRFRADAEARIRASDPLLQPTEAVDGVLPLPPRSEPKSDAPTLSAEEREREAWSRAASKGTKEAWLTYLDHHAGSPRIAQAREMFAEASAYAHALKFDSPNAWNEYMQRWPKGAHRADAESRLGAVQARLPKSETQPSVAVPATQEKPAENVADIVAEKVAELLPPLERPRDMAMWITAIILTALMFLLAVFYGVQRWQESAAPPDNAPAASDTTH